MLVICSPAAANCLNAVYDESLPVTSSSPADGASVTPSPSSAVPFEVVSVHGAAGFLVRVTTQNVLGDDGTLSDLNMADEFALAESTTNFGVYQGVSLTGPTHWTNVPGRYYWQIFGYDSYFDPSTGTIVCHAYKSAVYTINVVAPSGGSGSPPPITLSDAKRYATIMVRQRTHRTASGTISCSRVNSFTLHCNLAWTAGGYSYRASGRFWNYIASDGNAYWWYDFSGTRFALSCLAQHSRSWCGRHFRWH
jgi:hypothetical protein